MACQIHGVLNSHCRYCEQLYQSGLRDQSYPSSLPQPDITTLFREIMGVLKVLDHRLSSLEEMVKQLKKD